MNTANMVWQETDPDVRPERLSCALRSMDAGRALQILLNLARGKRIYVEQSCVDSVMEHIRPERNEVGGLLLGTAWQDDLQDGGLPVVFIRRSVRSHDFINSPVSLRMNTGVWDAATAQLGENEFVVGWYHSHPNLGAFFSGTDRYTQRNFFYHDYSVGWVIDPVRNQEKMYLGGGSVEYNADAIIGSSLPSACHPDWP